MSPWLNHGLMGEHRQATAQRGGTFRSLRVRNFRLFIVGQILSNTGTWMHWVAAPFLVLQLTGSGVALGIDAALMFLPLLLFGAWGGLLADRFDNRRLLVVAQIAYAVPAAVLWLLVVTGVVEVWMVYLLSFITGCATVVDMPTRQSFYIEMVGRDQLTNAMSLNTATFTGTRIVGPALAGVLIAWIGVGPVFLLNALSYLAVIAALVLMRGSELQRRELAPRARGQIREGIRHVWRTPGLRVPMLLMAVVFLFAYNFQVLMPLMAVRDFDGDAGTYGWMLALHGVGSLAGALYMAKRTSRPDIPRLAWLGVAIAVFSAAVAVAPTLAVALAVLPFLGAATIAFPIVGNSTLQLTAAESVRGRVMALYTVIFLGTTPIGGPLAGAVGEHVGARAGLLAGGVIALVAAVATLMYLARRIEPRPEPASEAPAPSVG